MRRFGCLLPSLLAAVLLYAGAANLSRCFVVSNAATGVGSRVSRAAVQLDVPMKEADLIQPSEEPSRSSYLFGFVPFAEQLNGRIAMIFFFVLILQEYFTGKGLFELAGEILGGSS
ncbi:unnamed protein product [Effrenium voratum]|nr:unnamed protein product [Effrenium voratum]CAJ1452919.1 unnamed protein product [Effrenium voratum]|mmetsp:Transcript_65024/g.155287  ORF Transcript_65024/g.155287 Transcript_65024/m.155287 type:complete len:116 (-) Transcript_65024:145-492(-)